MNLHSFFSFEFTILTLKIDLSFVTNKISGMAVHSLAFTLQPGKVYAISFPSTVKLILSYTMFFP